MIVFSSTDFEIHEKCLCLYFVFDDNYSSILYYMNRIDSISGSVRAHNRL